MSEKTTTGRLVAAVGGILLIVSLFLTWAGSSADTQPLSGVSVDLSFNAFDLFGFMPFVFLLIGVLAFLPAVLDIFDLDIELPFDNSLVAIIGGVLALGAMLLVLDGPGGAKIGVWLAVLAAIAVTAGGIMQMNEAEAAGSGGFAPAPTGYAAPAPASPPAAAPPASPPPAVTPPATPPPSAAPPAAAPPQQQPPAPPQPPQPPPA